MNKTVEESKQVTRIFGLDLMRATAITMVVAGHCLWIYPQDDSLFHQILQLFGFFGVEIFFVLSGFLIGKILYQLYLKEDFSLATVFYFLKRRWFRTLPNYYLVLLINILIAGIIGYEMPQLWRYFFFLQNFKITMLLFFTESWSLSVEEFAYVVLPFFILFLGVFIKPKNKSKFFFWAILLLILLFIFNKLYYQNTTNNTTLDQWNVSLKAVVLYRLDSIFIGVLFSWIYLNFSSFWEKTKYLFFILGTLLLLFLFFSLGYFGLLIAIQPLFWNVLYLPLLSIAVACFLPFLSDWKAAPSFIAKPITYISIISYSIYLLHYSVVLQLMKYFFPMDVENRLGLYFFTIIYLLITLVLSTILYRFYEKPMMDLRDK
ncbi:acyltransferase family protein [Flavobacterium sp. RSB2_4_14]|uniref:acyltransferase family protein n=1 Tax=Flavobacterium sp. RSB2_4_14 TaxID=3447665 RepID=UPI003F2D3AFF